MIITQEEVVNRQTVLHIELEDEDLDPYLDRGYQRMAQRTVIPGFRKGKAPRTIVERYLGRESLLNEVLDSMVPEVTSRAIDEQALDAVGLPKIDVLDTDPFTLKAIVPLKPEVDLGAYRGLRVPEVAVEFEDKHVELALDQIRQSMGSWEPVDRSVQMGDTVTLDALGKAGDRTLLDDRDAVVFLDEHNTRPTLDFAEKLIGATIGERREFTVTIPDDYEDPEVAGQEASFSVSVIEIKERELPEMDDEFAKSYGDGYESLQALREKVEADLRAEADRRAEQEYREAVVDALVEGASVELSPVMVEHEVEHMEEERQRVLSRVNVRTDDYLKSIGKTADEVRDEMEAAAAKRLARTFSLSTVTELEAVEASDDEVEERVRSLLEDSGQESDEQQVTDELRSSIRQMVLSEKTVDRLITIARVEATDEEAPATEQGEATGEEAPATEQGEATGEEAPATEQGEATDEEAPATEQDEGASETAKDEEGGDTDDREA